MLRCSALRASLRVRAVRDCATRAAASAPGRADVADVERLSRGEGAKRRGTGSRDVPHRLNAEERTVWELAKKRRYLVLTGTGYRRERKGSPLANSWRQLADALAHSAVTVQRNGASEPAPDTVVVDLSPLREARARCLEVRDVCVALAATCAAGTTLARDEAATCSETNDELLERAIWQLPPVLLEFTCADRPSAKALAEALALELCGGPLAEGKPAESKRRAKPVEEDA